MRFDDIIGRSSEVILMKFTPANARLSCLSLRLRKLKTCVLSGWIEDAICAAKEGVNLSVRCPWKQKAAKVTREAVNAVEILLRIAIAALIKFGSCESSIRSAVQKARLKRRRHTLPTRPLQRKVEDSIFMPSIYYIRHITVNMVDHRYACDTIQADGLEMRSVR